MACNNFWVLIWIPSAGLNSMKLPRERLTPPLKTSAVDMDLVDSQQARRILDRLVGYSLSPFLWKKVKKGLSGGRVQSVVTRIIVDRKRKLRPLSLKSTGLDLELKRWG